jgi:hypothetical protein
MSKRIFKCSVASLLVLLILVAPVAASTTRTEYAGKEYYDGAITGGRQWVSKDGVLHIRGGEEAYRDVVSDPRPSGNSLVTVNAKFHLAEPPVYVYGRMWRTFRIDNDGGYWEGHWVGERTHQGSSYIRTVLHGQGGYDGLLARADYVRETPDPTAPFSISGVVMNPGGKWEPGGK